MLEIARKFKKIKILAIFLSIVAVVIYIIIPHPPKPVCENGKLDQGEKQVDCGGMCSACAPDPDYDINIDWKAAVKDGEENYDLIAKVNNKNTGWGVSSVNYRFTLYDKDDKKIGIREGSTYIVPKGYTESDGEKYIIENDFKSKTAIKRVDFEFYDYSWQEVEGSLDISELNKEIIKVKSTRFGIMEDGSAGYYAYGETRNDSIYSFNDVEIKVVLFDKDNNPIAAGETNQRTLRDNSGWEFRVFWNESFEEIANSADFEAETNIFATENFMQRHGTGRNYKNGVMNYNK